MAVPGRKETPTSSSVHHSSSDDCDHECDACLTGGQHVEAFGFCEDCQDFLCATCFRSHSKNKASRHHKLLDKTTSPPRRTSSLSSETCVEKCEKHTKEIVKFFCPKHSAVGCNDCMTLGHRTCEIDYIPEKCSGIENSSEYTQVIQDLNTLLDKVSSVEKLAKSKTGELDKGYNKVIEVIDKFQKDINERIAHLRENTIEEAKKIKKMREEDIQSVINTCEKLSSNVKQVQESITENTKTKMEGQIFISVKRGKNVLRSHDMELAAKSIQDIEKEMDIERSKDIENILRTQCTLGNFLGKERAPPVPRKNDKNNAAGQTPPGGASHFRANFSPPTFHAPPPPIPSPNRVPPDPKSEQLEGQEWYHGEIDRFNTNSRLFAVGQDGTFLVRKSTQGDVSQPYSLAVLYHSHVYNLKIRKKTDGRVAIGEEKPNELTFKDVVALIYHHRTNNVQLLNLADKKVYITTLRQYAKNKTGKR